MFDWIFPLKPPFIDDFSIKTSIEFGLQPRLTKGLMASKALRDPRPSLIFPTFVGGINCINHQKSEWFIIDLLTAPAELKRPASARLNQ